MLFSTSKQSFPKLPNQLMPITGVISRVVTPKSNPLAREKARIETITLSIFKVKVKQIQRKVSYYQTPIKI